MAKSTRDWLNILSKGENVYQDRLNTDLGGRSARFLEMFEERERHIMAKKAEVAVPLPFLETIKRKVAKMVEAPNTEMPIVTRFDLYTGIRKMSERAPADTGLKRLASQLERAWHQEPMGAVTYGQVSAMVNLYKDQFPRSKAADAIEAECTRVGMHKLPVAKLARIASSINSQEDYDMVMLSAGYAGDRPEQVRARSLVRELVAMRGGAVDSREKQGRDERTIGERVAARVAQMQEFDENHFNQYEQQTQGDTNIGPGATNDQGHSTRMLDPNDMVPGDDAGTPLDLSGIPSAGPISPTQRVNNGYIPTPNQYRAQKAPFAPPVDEMIPGIGGEEPELPMPDAPLDMDISMGTAGDGELQPNELEDGVDIVHEIDQAAQDIIQNAPPEAQDYIDHEMTEGHTSPPGTAEWGAEEILNEGHEFPPPSEGWLQEEMEEMGKSAQMHSMHYTERDEQPQPYCDAELTDDNVTTHPQLVNCPDCIGMMTTDGRATDGHEQPYEPFDRHEDGSKMAAKGKGIPLPKGEIKQQPNADSSKVEVPENGGQTLKASQVEAEIHDGKTVTAAGLSIRINDDMEVEVFDKSGGKACDLSDIDTAVADFVRLATVRTAAIKRASKARRFGFAIRDLISVPCEACASVSVFPVSRKASDEYGCECGHSVSASLANGILAKIAGHTSYKLDIVWNAKSEQQFNRIATVLGVLPSVDTTHSEPGYAQFIVTGNMHQLHETLVKLGGEFGDGYTDEQLGKWRTRYTDALNKWDRPSESTLKPGDVAITVRPLKTPAGEIPAGAKVYIDSIADGMVTIGDRPKANGQQWGNERQAQDLGKLKNVLKEKQPGGGGINPSKPNPTTKDNRRRVTVNKRPAPGEPTRPNAKPTGANAERRTVQIPVSELQNLRPAPGSGKIDTSAIDNRKLTPVNRDESGRVRQQDDDFEYTEESGQPEGNDFDIDVEEPAKPSLMDRAKGVFTPKQKPGAPADLSKVTRDLDRINKKFNTRDPRSPKPQAPAAPKGPKGPGFWEGLVKSSQMAPAQGQPQGQPQSGQNPQQMVTDMPLEQVISAAFTNYKAQGMNLPKALRTFFKEHGDLVEQRWSDSDVPALLGMAEQLWSQSQPGNVETPAAAGTAPENMDQIAPPADAPATMDAMDGGPSSMPLMAQKVFDVSIRKPKDHVSVGKKPLGKDTQGEDLIPSPGKIKNQQGKPQGKFSPTDLGEDSDGKDITLAKPKKTQPTRGKLPSTDMGHDSEGDEGFSVPGIGAKPSIGRKAEESDPRCKTKDCHNTPSKGSKYCGECNSAMGEDAYKMKWKDR